MALQMPSFTFGLSMVCVKKRNYNIQNVYMNENAIMLLDLLYNNRLTIQQSQGEIVFFTGVKLKNVSFYSLMVLPFDIVLGPY